MRITRMVAYFNLHPVNHKTEGDWTEEHEIKTEKTGQCSRQCATDDAGFEKIAQAMGIHFCKKGLASLNDTEEMSEGADED